MLPKRSKRSVVETVKPAALSASEKPQASRRAVDRSCLGDQNTVTEQDRRLSVGSSPNSRKNRASASVVTSSNLQDRVNTISTAPLDPHVFVGVDIAKDKFDVHVRPLAKKATFTNDPSGFDLFVKYLKQFPTLQLLAEISELGTVNRNQIAALGGLAPYNHDSGKLKGRRSISGGRPNVRSAIYMAAFSARRCNPIFKAFAKRLEDAGKPYLVIQVACLRKLLITLNAMLKTGLTWNRQIVQEIS